MTTSGWESIGTWLLATSVTLAPMRLKTQRCRSEWTVWSQVASKYQLSSLRQATWSAMSFCSGEVRRPHQPLLVFRQVAREEFGAGGEHQGQVVGDLHATEDVGRVPVELVLHGLARVGRDRRDVDEADDAIVHARAGDGRAAVGVADQQDRAA